MRSVTLCGGELQVTPWSRYNEALTAYLEGVIHITLQSWGRAERTFAYAQHLLVESGGVGCGGARRGGLPTAGIWSAGWRSCWTFGRPLVLIHHGDSAGL